VENEFLPHGKLRGADRLLALLFVAFRGKLHPFVQNRLLLHTVK